MGMSPRDRSAYVGTGGANGFRCMEKGRIKASGYMCSLRWHIDEMMKGE